MTFFNQNTVWLCSDLHYTIFRKGKRVIFAPDDELKRHQRYLKKALNWAYPLKMSILNSAKIHCGKKWVLKTDIKNFYESVPYEFIEKVVRNACKKIKLADINFYLMISTVDKKLPTGAATSAHIANACFKPVDERIKNYCKTFGVNYSRYMDDMTFSCDEKIYLKMVEEFLNKTLAEFGFSLNKKKTRYISRNKRQEVLGLVVNNDKAGLSKDFKRKIRAMIHSYCIFKTCGAKAVDLKYRAWGNPQIQQLMGYLSYIKSVDKEFYIKLEKYAKRLGVDIKNPYYF